MISWAVAFDRRVMRVVDEDTYRWFLGSRLKFRQTAVVVMKDSVQK